MILLKHRYTGKSAGRRLPHPCRAVCDRVGFPDRRDPLRRPFRKNFLHLPSPMQDRNNRQRRCLGTIDDQMRIDGKESHGQIGEVLALVARARISRQEENPIPDHGLNSIRHFNTGGWPRFALRKSLMTRLPHLSRFSMGGYHGSRYLE